MSVREEISFTLPPSRSGPDPSQSKRSRALSFDVSEASFELAPSRRPPVDNKNASAIAAPSPATNSKTESDNTDDASFALSPSRRGGAAGSVKNGAAINADSSSPSFSVARQGSQALASFTASGRRASSVSFSLAPPPKQDPQHMMMSASFGLDDAGYLVVPSLSSSARPGGFAPNNDRGNGKSNDAFNMDVTEADDAVSMSPASLSGAFPAQRSNGDGNDDGNRLAEITEADIASSASAAGRGRAADITEASSADTSDERSFALRPAAASPGAPLQVSPASAAPGGAREVSSFTFPSREMSAKTAAPTTATVTTTAVARRHSSVLLKRHIAALEGLSEMSSASSEQSFAVKPFAGSPPEPLHRAGTLHPRTTGPAVKPSFAASALQPEASTKAPPRADMTVRPPRPLTQSTRSAAAAASQSSPAAKSYRSDGEAAFYASANDADLASPSSRRSGDTHSPTGSIFSPVDGSPGAMAAAAAGSARGGGFGSQRRNSSARDRVFGRLSLISVGSPGVFGVNAAVDDDGLEDRSDKSSPSGPDSMRPGDAAPAPAAEAVVVPPAAAESVPPPAPVPDDGARQVAQAAATPPVTTDAPPVAAAAADDDAAYDALLRREAAREQAVAPADAHANSDNGKGADGSQDDDHEIDEYDALLRRAEDAERKAQRDRDDEARWQAEREEISVKQALERRHKQQREQELLDAYNLREERGSVFDVLMRRARAASPEALEALHREQKQRTAAAAATVAPSTPLGLRLLSRKYDLERLCSTRAAGFAAWIAEQPRCVREAERDRIEGRPADVRQQLPAWDEFIAAEQRSEEDAERSAAQTPLPAIASPASPSPAPRARPHSAATTSSAARHVPRSVTPAAAAFVAVSSLSARGHLQRTAASPCAVPSGTDWAMLGTAQKRTWATAALVADAVEHVPLPRDVIRREMLEAEERRRRELEAAAAAAEEAAAAEAAAKQRTEHAAFIAADKAPRWMQQQRDRERTEHERWRSSLRRGRVPGELSGIETARLDSSSTLTSRRVSPDRNRRNYDNDDDDDDAREIPTLRSPSVMSPRPPSATAQRPNSASQMSSVLRLVQRSVSTAGML